MTQTQNDTRPLAPKASTPTANLPAIQPPRLPFHPLVEERFGVDKSQWKALVEAIFPLAQSVDSVCLALSYCRARKLDPFKKNVHIVPIWDSSKNRMVDTIWPGIGELRTTAFRTGHYAGKSKTEFGPDITRKVGNADITFPEWAQITVKRILPNGSIGEFEGPKVYWMETYTQAKRNDQTPNSMWMKRPRGQLEKTAEAAALRAAFPEEIGNEYTDDEMGAVLDTPSQQVIDQKPSTPPTTKTSLRNGHTTPTVEPELVNETVEPDGEVVTEPVEQPDETDLYWSEFANSFDACLNAGETDGLKSLLDQYRDSFISTEKYGKRFRECVSLYEGQVEPPKQKQKTK